jgi:acyl transferase domain-containing protein
LTVWPTPGVRRASVNSFGFGGTNAHVIVEDAYHYLESRGLNGRHFTVLNPQLPSNGIDLPKLWNSTLSKPNANLLNGEQLVRGNGEAEGFKMSPMPKLFILSSQDQSGILRAVKNLLPYAESQFAHSSGSDEQLFLDDLSYTLGERRSIMPWKSFAVASTLEKLRRSLNAIPPAVRSSQVPKMSFTFTGQGAQWFAMGRELLLYCVYRDSLRLSEDVLESLGCCWSLAYEMSRPEGQSRLNVAEISQPCCTALQIALVDLLWYWDVYPVAVVGHSSGEIAAAYCSRLISRESAIKIAWFRGQSAATIGRNSGINGAMMAVNVDADFIRPSLQELTKGKVVVACINSPNNCTVSGDVLAIEELRNILDQQQISCTKLKVGVAYHSPHMEHVRDEYLKALSNIPTTSQLSDNFIPMFSSVTGDLIRPQSLSASYWVDNLVSPVNFSGAVGSLLKHSESQEHLHDRRVFANTFLEIGPHSALRGPLKDIFSHEDNVSSNLSYITILRRGRDAANTALQAMGELYCRGYNLALTKINETNPEVKMLVDLPVYPWNRSNHFWEESRITRDYRLRDRPRLDLLGYPCPGTVEPQWRNFLRSRENPWIEHHKVGGND